MSKFWKDLIERVLWTALQAGLGVITIETFDWPKAWIPLIAFGLSAIKGLVAKQIGDPESASTAPGV